MNIALIAHNNRKELMVRVLHRLLRHPGQAYPLRHRHHRPDGGRGHRPDHPPFYEL